MYDVFLQRPYRVLNGIEDGNTTRSGLFALLTAHSVSFSGFEFWSDITMTLLDNYLNSTLRTNQLIDEAGEHIEYDHALKLWKVKSTFPYQALGDALIGDMVSLEGYFKLMTTENLNIIEYDDVDTNEYGQKVTVHNYDKVEIELKNGQKVRKENIADHTTDYDYPTYDDSTEYGEAVTTNDIAARTNTEVQGVSPAHAGDETIRSVMGFNSNAFSDAEKTVTKKDKMTTTLGGGLDTVTNELHTDTLTHGAHKDVVKEHSHLDTFTDEASTDNHNTKARVDRDTVQTYIDEFTHTKHIIMDPYKYYEIQKEMADFDIYPQVREIVKAIICKGVW